MAGEYTVSKKYHEMSIYAAETAEQIVRNRREWTKFLTTAARVYKYPFEDQLMIYAQRPDAGACAPLETWNEKLFCWVNRGAKGIALFDRESARPRLRYVFDITDVRRAKRIGRYPYLWRMEDRHKEAVLLRLEKYYGKTDETKPFEGRLIELAKRLAADYSGELLKDLDYAKEDSFLEEYDELNLSMILRETLADSIAYTLLYRCEADMDVWGGELDFSHISDFNTMNSLSVMGNATADICKPILMEIGRTIAAYEKKRDKGLEKQTDLHYNALKRESENAEQTEKEGAEYGTDIREMRGLFGSQPDTGHGAGGGADEVRTDAQGLPEGTPEGNLQRDGTLREAEGALPAGTETGAGENGTPDRTDDENRGSGRGTEGSRPDGMGSEDERDTALSGGISAVGIGLRAIIDSEQQNTETQGPGIDTLSVSGSSVDAVEYSIEMLDAQREILCNDHYHTHKRTEIAGYFTAGCPNCRRRSRRKTMFGKLFPASVGRTERTRHYDSIS